MHRIEGGNALKAQLSCARKLNSHFLWAKLVLTDTSTYFPPQHSLEPWLYPRRTRMRYAAQRPLLHPPDG